MSKQSHWESMYKLPIEKIPWEIEEPPKELVETLKNKDIKPGKALDIACGTGNYSIYLAKNTFDVIGVDFSKTALNIARKKANQQKLKIKFIYANVLNLSKILNEKFDFILDYSLLHHISSTNIEKFASQFSKLLKKGGRLLLVCYSDKDSNGKKSVMGKYGNNIYFRTVTEIRKLYKGLNEIRYKEAYLGKKQQHQAHYFLFQN